MGKNLARSEDYALLFSSLICFAVIKKVVLSMELPLTMWPTQLLHDLLPLLWSNVHSLTVPQLWNNTITLLELNTFSC